MVAVPIGRAGAGLEPGKPTRLFDWPFSAVQASRGWDVTPDGRTFYAIEVLPAPVPSPSNLVLVTGFLNELRRRSERTTGDR
jgi:hypothetical protein